MIDLNPELIGKYVRIYRDEADKRPAYVGRLKSVDEDNAHLNPGHTYWGNKGHNLMRVLHGLVSNKPLPEDIKLTTIPLEKIAKMTEAENIAGIHPFTPVGIPGFLGYS